jgi:hypothetical protein
MGLRAIDGSVQVQYEVVEEDGDDGPGEAATSAWSARVA